jgi:uncharacterized membrane protein
MRADSVDTTVATILAWAPWVALAAGVGVLFADGLATVLGMELVGPSAVVLGVAAAGWLAVRRWFPRGRAAEVFGVAGLALVVPVLVVSAQQATVETAGWLLVALAGALVLGIWGRRAIARYGGSERASSLGGFVVFGQAFDALTTAVGIDILGYGEQNALSAAILTFAEGLPLSDVAGTGWLFIAVKLALAVGVVALFVDGSDDAENTVIVALAAFAGFGPAVHNVVLFATT